MATTIHSVSFQENKVSWIQASVSEKSIVVQRAVESLLPLVINFENIGKPTIPIQTANHLKSLIKYHDMTLGDEVRFLIPAKFSLVKKILVDTFLTGEDRQQFAVSEFYQSVIGGENGYDVYLPDYEHRKNGYSEILSVGIRRELTAFMKELAQKAGLSLSQLNISCFTIDSFYRKMYPNDLGQTLLVNFTERGYEMTISDDKDFLDCTFRPYSKSMESIEQLDDEEVLSDFDRVLEDIQKAAPGDTPSFSFAQIYLYGAYFKSQWIEILEAQTGIPLGILNPFQSAESFFASEDPSLNPDEAYRFVEPLSNLL